jgi:GntR family transcriptional regulator, transcriptional repressor for pyruvate dehydrogenase complex
MYDDYNVEQTNTHKATYRMNHPTLNTDLTSYFNRQRRSCIITQELKNLLLSGALKVGDKLPTEAALCQTYGVSRTTLREAVQNLRNAGLLDITPGRGSYVRKPQVAEALADFALIGKLLDAQGTASPPLRALLTTYAVAAAVKAPLAERQALFAHSVERNLPPEENAKRELAWHSALVKLSGNPLTELMVGCLLQLEAPERTHTFTDPDTVLRTYTLQMRVTQALIDGDITTAQRSLSSFICPDMPPTFALAA